MCSLAIRPLNKSLEVVAREQLYEEPDKIHEHLELLKEWIKKSGHLKARTDDQFLICFLRGCKYRIEQSKKKVDMFYTLRTHMPELISKRDPMDEKLNEVIKLGVMLPMPDTESPGSPRILLIRPGVYNAHIFSIENVAKLSSMVNDILMVEDDNSAVAGQIAIVDLQNVTFAHLTQMHPALAKKLAMLSQDGRPIRQKGVHYINAPIAFEKIFNLFKSFMNEKVKSRLFIHSSIDTLYKVVPRKLMPTEYEGEGASLKELTDVWEKKILSYRDYFLEDDTIYGVDEKKRVGQPKNASSLFGIDGTFRQLDFD